MPPMPVHAVDKPIGPTSHDLVARARKLLGTRRVGHAGTLDPLASGVLLLLSEDATKLSPWLTGSDKRYLAWVAFGADTPTWDAEGPIGRRGDPSDLTEVGVASEAARFLTVRAQVPPRFSAVKRGGEASYRAARRADPAARAEELPERPAAYRRVRLLAFGARDALPDRFGPGADDGGWQPRDDGRVFELPPPLAELPVALFALEVAAGTYVRAFARDLGVALGVPAHLAGLVRTHAGGIDLARTVPPDRLAEAPGVPEAEALPLEIRTLDPAQARRVRSGQRLPASELPGDGTVGLVDEAGRMVAVAELSPRGMRLLRVWS